MREEVFVEESGQDALLAFIINYTTELFSNFEESSNPQDYTTVIRFELRDRSKSRRNIENCLDSRGSLRETKPKKHNGETGGFLGRCLFSLSRAC